MSSPLIDIRSLQFIYDRGKPNEHHALKDINIQIGHGEYVAFFGPSGCGKSTLLSAIAGIESPTSGTIEVAGRDIAKLNENDLSLYRQRGVGIIFQNFNLIPSISILENVALPASFMGIERDVRNKKATEALDRLGLLDLKDRFPYELSGGQQQRVGIARALVNEPPIMLADEPLGNLDSVNANLVLEFLKNLNEKDGETVIMVTHESWSLRDARTVFHMKDGVITKVEQRKKGIFVMEGGGTTAAERAHGFSDFLLPGYPKEQTERLASFIAELIDKKITIKEFGSKLDMPYKDGGAGLWKQRAEHVTKAMEHAIKESADIDAVGKKLHDNPQASLREEVERLRVWLFEDDAYPLAASSIPAVDSLIEARIRGKMSGEDFKKNLNLPRSQGGAGLRTTRVLKATAKMDTLLSSYTAEEEKEPKKK
jgi:putative ABC transport system ATP-binding protein